MISVRTDSSGSCKSKCVPLVTGLFLQIGSDATGDCEHLQGKQGLLETIKNGSFLSFFFFIFSDRILLSLFENFNAFSLILFE